MTTSQLYQLSTVGALCEAVYDSSTSCAALAQHGDFGLGAFNRLDGELIIIDGLFYQVSPDGSAHQARDNQQVAFATITSIAGSTVQQSKLENCDQTALKAFIDCKARSTNLFYALRAHGSFKSIALRSVVCQHRPYPAFKDVAAHQAEFEFQNITGTLVGFRAPTLFSEITVGGYHFHFIDDARTRGGHVIEFLANAVEVDIHELSRFVLDLPETADYLNAPIGTSYAKSFDDTENKHASQQCRAQVKSDNG